MYIYLFESDGYYKIGIAENVNTRVKQLQTGNPHKITVKSSIKVQDKNMAFRIERAFHSVLGNNRASGEWFKVDAELVEETFSVIQQQDYKRLYALTDAWNNMIKPVTAVMAGDK